MKISEILTEQSIPMKDFVHNVQQAIGGDLSREEIKYAVAQWNKNFDKITPEYVAKHIKLNREPTLDDNEEHDFMQRSHKRAGSDGP